MSQDPFPSLELARHIGHLALEKKASRIKVLDVRGLTSMTDAFVICSGSSDVQVKAITDHILDSLAPGEKVLSKEGYDTREWVLLDYVDVVVHIFHDSAREFYNLDRLWTDAQIETISDETSSGPEVPLFEDL